MIMLLQNINLGTDGQDLEIEGLRPEDLQKDVVAIRQIKELVHDPQVPRENQDVLQTMFGIVLDLAL